MTSCSGGLVPQVDGAHVQPVAVAVDDSDLTKPNRIRVVVAEGRNREVRVASLLGKDIYY